MAPAKFIILCTFGFATAAYGGLTPCSGTYALGNSNSNDLLPGGGSSAGCEQVDKLFTAFAYTPGVSNPVDGSTVPVIFSGTVPIGPVSVQFGTSSGSTWDVSTNGASTGGTAAYNVAIDTSYPTPGGQFYTITRMSLGEQYTLTAGTTVVGNDGISLTEYFCAGGASACSGGSAATGGINMTAATAGFIVFTLSGNSNGTTSTNKACFNNGNTVAATDCATPANAGTGSQVNFALSNFAQGFQSIYTFTTFTVSSGGDELALNFFKDNYFQALQTPEPATFGMLGAALAGLVLLGVRRQKVAIQAS